jgi:hypothetical protein
MLKAEVIKEGDRQMVCLPSDLHFDYFPEVPFRISDKRLLISGLFFRLHYIFYTHHFSFIK